MGHVVHYRSAIGERHLEDVPSLPAAVELIERLRNEEDASDVRLFREVPIQVRTYYKVIVEDEHEDGDERAQPTPASCAEPAGHLPPPGAMNLSPAPPATPAVPVSAGEHDDEPRRVSLFNRG